MESVAAKSYIVYRVLLVVIVFLYVSASSVNGAPSENSPVAQWNAEKQAYLDKLLTLVNQRRVKEALAGINARIRSNPKDPCYYAMRARVYVNIDENDAALSDADKALSMSPRLMAALLAKCNALLRTERLKEALIYNDKAYALEPEANYVLDDRIDILAALGRRNEAIKLLEKQLVGEPKDHVRRGQLIKLYAAEKASGKVIEQVAVQLKLSDARNKDFFLTLRGDAYARLKLYKNAEQDYSQALKVNVNCFEAYRGLIKVYKIMGGKTKEIEVLERQLKELEGDIRPL